MSIIHCEHCGQNIDTDFNSEHFYEDDSGCENCEVEKIPQFKGTLEALDKIKIIN